MIALEPVGFVWASLGYLAMSLTSAVVPWVNAEVLVLSLPAIAQSHAELVGLVLIVTTGQMTGKGVVYWAGLVGSANPSPRIASALQRWRHRLAGRPWAAFGLVFVSSAIGMPPFYLMSLLAGAMRLSFVWFLVLGTAGRLTRFGLIVALAATALPANDQ